MKKKFKNLKNIKSKKQKDFSIKKDERNIYIYTFDDKDVVRAITLPKSYFIKVLASN